MRRVLPGVLLSLTVLVVLLLVAAGGTSAAVGTAFKVNSTANAQDGRDAALGWRGRLDVNPS